MTSAMDGNRPGARRVVIIDNYDSFSYNLYQSVGMVCENVCVVRNDDFTPEEIEGKFMPTHVILSPGPGRPADAGVCEAAALYFAGKIPVLGVCLGHQSICEAYGGTVSYAKEICHGVRDEINIDNSCPIFFGLGKTISAARYHSLACTVLPREASVIATAKDGEIMGIRINGTKVFGLQFHPESHMTPDGMKIIENFLKM